MLPRIFSAQIRQHSAQTLSSGERQQRRRRCAPVCCIVAGPVCAQEQVATSHMRRDALSQFPCEPGDRHAAGRQVRLVVVDSVPFHFRQDRQDVGERTRLLSQIGQSLMALAGRHDICVRSCRGRLQTHVFLPVCLLMSPADLAFSEAQTCIAQLSDQSCRWSRSTTSPPVCLTALAPSSSRHWVIHSVRHVYVGTASASHHCLLFVTIAYVFCAGDSWAHSATNRLMLRFDGEHRVAHLVKSPSSPDGVCAYTVTMDGIRDH